MHCSSLSKQLQLILHLLEHTLTAQILPLDTFRLSFTINQNVSSQALASLYGSCWQC